MAVVCHVRTKEMRSNRYLDFDQTRGLIPLADDNHVDNNLNNFGVCVISLQNSIEDVQEVPQ